MGAPLTVPVGELSSFGVGKETTFGVFATPTLFHAVEDCSPTPKNILIPRSGARKRRGQNLPIVGGYEGKLSLTPEPDPDTVGQLLAYSMGAQTAPTLNVVNTTLSANTSIGATAFTCSTTIGMQPGMLLSFDTAGNQESLTVLAITGAGAFSTTSAATKAHTSGGAITCTSTTAYLTTLTLGTLPTWSAELNRVTDTVDYTACMIDSFSIDSSTGKYLQTKFNAAYQTEAIQGSPTSPTFSTKLPPAYDNPNNTAIIFGTAYGASGQVAVGDWSVSGSNNIGTNYRSFGAGRNIVNYPQQQRKFTGKVSLGFESDQAYKAFLGNASSATSPQSSVPGVALDFRMFTTDVLDSTNNLFYAFHFYLGNVFLETHGAPIKSSSVIMQQFTYQAAETANGANDDLKISLVNGNSTIY